MEFSLTLNYPAGLDRLWEVFGRPDYPENKYRSLGSSDIRVLHFRVGAEVIEVELERTAPVAWGKIPAWARAFLSSRQVMRHSTRWQRVSPTRVEAELDIVPLGKRVSAHGTGSIVQLSPDLTRMILRFVVESTFPALGARAARLYARQIREALRADHAFTLDYLKEMAPRPA